MSKILGHFSKNLFLRKLHLKHVTTFSSHSHQQTGNKTTATKITIYASNKKDTTIKLIETVAAMYACGATPLWPCCLRLDLFNELLEVLMECFCQLSVELCIGRMASQSKSWLGVLLDMPFVVTIAYCPYPISIMYMWMRIG